ncbi:hypothetical protein EW146_g2184 [Bondarzewia mesenterica]|uniref:Family A G protein-coupled receptor-like protein n=1 Tax=Bondarzewia mesenterica TaxID=1095465 RepID=A0A4S4M2Z2_9AGAM|nr:hypothetical protein EW146_g2184 [Bondarzewia mesenterica]
MSNITIIPQMLNDALKSNPPTANLHISTHASDWLWTVFCLMALSFLIVLVRSFMRPKNFIFHQFALIILITASLAYFSMASDLGHAPITVEFNRSHVGPITRNIFYVRYIQWFINAPLIILLLFIGTGFPLGIPLGHTFSPIFFTEVAVIGGLVGAVVHSTYKWGYYVFGVFGLFYVFTHLIFNVGRFEYPSPTGRTHGSFLATSVILACIWFIYPIIWALSEGGNVINPTAEMIWYGIMDLIAGPVFLAYFFWSHSEVDVEEGRNPPPRREKV